MFTQFLSRKDQSHSTSSKRNGSESGEMPKEVLGMDTKELLNLIGLSGVNVNNAGCLLVLVLRLRQCCSHMSLMCQVYHYMGVSGFDIYEINNLIILLLCCIH